MKKLLALMVVCFLLFPMIGIAEEINLESMSFDALLSLRDKIDDELTKRLYAENVIQHIPIGEYICGEHIAPGRYLFTNPDSKQRGVRIFENKEMLDQWEDLHFYFLKPNESAFVELKAGMILGIYDGDMIIEEANLPYAP